MKLFNEDSYRKNKKKNSSIGYIHKTVRFKCFTDREYAQ